MKASEHARAWKAAQFFVMRQLSSPELYPGDADHLRTVRTLCTAARIGYEEIAKEQEEQHG